MDADDGCQCVLFCFVSFCYVERTQAFAVVPWETCIPTILQNRLGTSTQGGLATIAKHESIKELVSLTKLGVSKGPCEVSDVAEGSISVRQEATCL